MTINKKKFYSILIALVIFSITITTILLACTPIEFLNNSYSWSELYTCAGDAQSISYSYLGKQQNNKTFPIYSNRSHTPYEFIKISNDSIIEFIESNTLIDLSHWHIGKEIYYQTFYDDAVQKAVISKIGTEQDMLGNNIEYAILKPQNGKKNLKILKNIGFPYHYGLGSKEGELPNCQTIFHLLELKKGNKVIYKPYIESEFKQIDTPIIDNIKDLTMSGIIQDDTLVINAYIPHYKGNLKILVKNIDNKLIIYPFNISPHEWTHSETNKTYCFEAKIKLLNINNIKSIVFSDWESFLYDDYPNKEFPIIKN